MGGLGGTLGGERNEPDHLIELLPCSAAHPPQPFLSNASWWNPVWPVFRPTHRPPLWPFLGPRPPIRVGPGHSRPSRLDTFQGRACRTYGSPSLPACRRQWWRSRSSVRRPQCRWRAWCAQSRPWCGCTRRCCRCRARPWPRVHLRAGCRRGRARRPPGRGPCRGSPARRRARPTRPARRPDLNIQDRAGVGIISADAAGSSSISCAQTRAPSP